MQIEPLKALSSSTDHAWFWEILIGLLVLIAINYLLKKVIKHIRQRALSHVHNWKEKIDHIFLLPVSIMLWILGGILVVEVTGRRFEFSFFDGYLSTFRTTVVVLCISWVLLRWKKEVQHSFLEKGSFTKKIDTGFVHVLGKILTITVVLIAAMIILQLWGLNIGPLIAFGGIGAAAIGFAAKDMIANFFGGLMLYITRPFMIGDLILISERNLEGTVEEIGWYLTSVRDKDKRPVYLPNAIFSTVLVINSSRMTHRRIEEKIRIRYEDFGKIKEIVEEIRSTMIALPEIDSHLPVLIYLNKLSDFSLEVGIDVYTLATRYDQYLAVRQEILSLTYGVLLAKGAEIPCPAMEIKTSLVPS
jgi:MscS family membrane protein